MEFPQTALQETPMEYRTVFRNHHKKHHFDYKNDVPLASSIGWEGSTSNSVFPSVKYETRNGSKALQHGIPDWITFDKQVLCFHAECLDSNEDRFKIVYFLEDDTIQLVGCNTGKEDKRLRATVIRRLKIPKPGKRTDHYLLDDLNVGRVVTFYGRSYHITGCDAFTRRYLTGLGLDVPDGTTTGGRLPSGDTRDGTIAEGRKKRHRFKQFLENDGNVLQFYCSWREPDDVAIKHSGAPITRRMTLRYFLADDTVEILEMTQSAPKSTVFVRRGKLPKKRVIEPLPLSQPETVGKPSDFYYSDGDFHIGNTVDVWGRQFHIYDCDSFTREFLRLKYGVEDVQSISSGVEDEFERKDEQSEILEQLEAKRLPDETEPKADFVKFMTRDHTSSGSHILRFLARLVGDVKCGSQETDKDRHFVVSYYLSDDSVSVFEKAERNSGNLGGKFMERNRVTKPNGIKEHLKPADFYVGAILCLNGHRFQLLDCDEYAKKYMEQHSDDFPFASGCNVLCKLKRIIGTDVQQLKRSFCAADAGDMGALASAALRKVIRERVDESVLNEHEILTLVRAYSGQSGRTKTTNSEQQFQFSSVEEQMSQQSMLQNELRRQQFDEFQGLLNYLTSLDPASTCLMTEERLLRGCRAYPLPAKKHLILALLSSLRRTEDGCIDYVEFVNKIDWKSNRAPDARKHSATDVHGPDSVNYKKLVNDMEELRC